VIPRLTSVPGLPTEEGERQHQAENAPGGSKRELVIYSSSFSLRARAPSQETPSWNTAGTISSNAVRRSST